MSIRTAQQRLNDATERLTLAWSVTRQVWADAAGRDFEQDVLEPLWQDVRASTAAMELVGERVTAARNECSE